SAVNEDWCCRRQAGTTARISDDSISKRVRTIRQEFGGYRNFHGENCPFRRKRVKCQWLTNIVIVQDQATAVALNSLRPYREIDFDVSGKVDCFHQAVISVSYRDIWFDQGRIILPWTAGK